MRRAAGVLRGALRAVRGALAGRLRSQLGCVTAAPVEARRWAGWAPGRIRPLRAVGGAGLLRLPRSREVHGAAALHCDALRARTETIPDDRQGPLHSEALSLPTRLLGTGAA